MTGRSLNVNGAISNLDGSGFNDRAQSAMIQSGTWQLCADSDYQGSCEVLVRASGRTSAACQDG